MPAAGKPSTKSLVAAMGDFNDSEAVGYRNPPLSGRFKKGKSGNPKGRPKHQKNPSTIAVDTLYRMMTLQENGRPVKRPALEVMMLRMVQEAIKDPVRGVPRLLAAMKIIAPDAFTDKYDDDGGIPKHGLLAVAGMTSVDQWEEIAATAVRPEPTAE